jgi:glycosyltransferase involved in cell wall biosynthesis
MQFLGQCHDVPAVLAGADLFVLPSRSEALPNAVIEAMAAGLPVVASNVGGIPELITNQVSGILVAPGDPRALARAVIDVMEQPGCALQMGREARDLVTREFGFGRLVARVEQLYLSAIARRAAAPVATAVGA